MSVLFQATCAPINIYLFKKIGVNQQPKISVKKNICIIYPNKSSSSETFIQAHINNLPCNVFKLYGGWFPLYTEDDIPLTDYSTKRQLIIFQRVKKKLGFGISLFYNDYPKMALYNFLKVHKIDAVLAEYGLTGVAVMDVCEEANIPLIVHFHGFDAYVNSVLKENSTTYQILFQKAAKIVVVSNDMLQQLRKLGAPDHKLKLNVCGVDIKKFSLSTEKIAAPIFLFSGRFVNKKAPHLVILCFSKTLLKVPDARLIMIGDGGLGSTQELYNGCRQLVKGLGIEYAVEFKGAMAHEDVAAVMKKSLVFIQHSVTTDTGDSEGTPVSLLEACASGLAVIGTKHAGIVDVIIHGVTGFLVNEYDLENTAAYMIKLANNIPLAQSMGIKARQRILDEYSLGQSITNLWNTIR